MSFAFMRNKLVEVEDFAGVEVANRVLRDSIHLYRAEEQRIRGWT